VAPYKHIRLTLPENGRADGFAIPEGVELLGREDGSLTLRVSRSEAPALTSRILSALPVADLLVEDPPIEEWIGQIYQEGVV
jgi:ABC-2 type transport system ATP-binding protein